MASRESSYTRITHATLYVLDIKIRSPWVASALCVSFFFCFSAPWGYRRDAAACSAVLAPMETMDHDPEAKEKTRTSLHSFSAPARPRLSYIAFLRADIVFATFYTRLLSAFLPALTLFSVAALYISETMYLEFLAI